MQIRALEMRICTLVVLVWSTKAVTAGDELSGEKSQKYVRKGTLKFARLRMPLLDSFYQDGLHESANLLSFIPDLGVA
jgi:hypothetical protein